MITTISKRYLLDNDEKAVSTLINKLSFAVWTLKTKMDGNENILRNIMVKSKLITSNLKADRVSVDLILLDTALEEAYSTRIMYIENELINRENLLEYANDHFVSLLFDGILNFNSFLPRDFVMQDISLTTIKSMLKTLNKSMDDLIVFKDISTDLRLLKINVSKNTNIFIKSFVH